MPEIIPRSFTAVDVVAALTVAALVIALSSRLSASNRHSLHAIIVAGAGSAYLSGGLGPWEFAFTGVATLVAWRGLADIRFIGLAWTLHVGWDIVHHLFGDPIVWAVPSSSAQCAVCDSVLAAWFLLGAPAVGVPDQRTDHSV